MNTELLQKAYHFLSLRDHSVKEIADKLKRKTENKAEIDEVVEYLKQHGYLNDLTFTEKYIDYKISRGNIGHLKIKYELLKKGINQQDIDRVFDSKEHDEMESAKGLLKKKRRSLEALDPLQRKNKLFSYFKNRGFKPETIYKVLENC